MSVRRGDKVGHAIDARRGKSPPAAATSTPPSFVPLPCATRHVLVDTIGLGLRVLVTEADVQDRDRGIRLLSSLFGQFPFLKTLFADSAYAGPIFRDGGANTMPSLAIEIVPAQYDRNGPARSARPSVNVIASI